VRGEGRDWEDCCSEDRGLGLEDLAMGSPARSARPGLTILGQA
jgi:hypothetical protein